MKMFTGIRLRAITSEDAQYTLAWRNSDEINSSIVGQKRFVSPETESRWVDMAISDHEGDKAYRFMIIVDGQSAPVGMVYLNRISRVNRTAVTGIMIGDLEHRGKGYASQATILLLDYAFHELGLHSIRANILSYNEASLKLYMSLGFKEEGCQRDAIFKGGRFHDLLMFSILEHEFYEQV
ncbi:MAG: GNAT family N-acetyltransferase [Flavobacteriales bacterium]|nr:GNAT family N-acetyltransferase [Flavobacteriales bacterium]